MNAGPARTSSRLAVGLLAALCWLGVASSAHAAAFTQVSTGLDHACGLRADHTVYCWGNGSSGQLGVIGVKTARVPVKVIGSYQTVQISSGQAFWCERFLDGTAACTGVNTAGQLGDGNVTAAEYPQDVVGLTGVTDISAGVTTACAVTGGLVKCWGEGRVGQLGDGQLQMGATTAPVTVPNLSGVSDVDVGGTSVCAVTGGQVMCWGDTADGKLGNDRSSLVTVAGIPVVGLTGVKTVAVGDRSACALKTDGTVWCWGDNSVGELGDGTNTSRFTPAAVAGLTGVTQIDVNGQTACALKSAGTVFCWGDGKLGEVGSGQKGVFNTPQQVQGIPDAAQVSVGATSACLVSRSQIPACWGSNQYGQLGSGTRTGTGQGSPSPTFVIDSLSPAVLLPPELAGLPSNTTTGGAVQLRALRLTKTGKYCPEFVRVTTTAKGRSETRKTKPNRINGACDLSGKYRLAKKTKGAKTATYAVRGSGIKTRKGSLKLFS